MFRSSVRLVRSLSRTAQSGCPAGPVRFHSLEQRLTFTASDERTREDSRSSGNSRRPLLGGLALLPLAALWTSARQEEEKEEGASHTWTRKSIEKISLTISMVLLWISKVVLPILLRWAPASTIALMPEWHNGKNCRVTREANKKNFWRVDVTEIWHEFASNWNLQHTPYQSCCGSDFI